MLWEKHREDDLPQVNMTPMVDVVLCLLIFFMAATKLYDWDEREFTVRVPQVDNAQPLTERPRDLMIWILNPGRVQIDADATSRNLEQLTEFLIAARNRYPDQGVVVRGDAGLSYQDLADVLSSCEAAGIQNVRLTVMPRDRPGAQPANQPPAPAPAAGS